MAAEHEADEISLDGDSAFGESISDQSDSTSVASSIRKYREENGRTYHSYGLNEYWGPNDEEQQDHLDISHQYYTLLFGGKLLHTPLKPGIHRVLDLGTGTGIWAIDFADLHPEADVKGVDISPIQPSFVPPNARFEIDDYNCEWYDEKKFDLIHQRDLNGSITDPAAFYANCFTALVPGGCMRISEIDPIDAYSMSHDGQPLSELVPADAAYTGSGRMFIVGCAAAGMDGRLAPKIERLLKDAGFTNIKAENVKVPIGTWPKDKKQKEIGAWNLLRLQTALEGIYMRLGTSQMGMTPAEVQVFCARTRTGLRESKWQLCHCVYLISAERPVDSSVQPSEV